MEAAYDDLASCVPSVDEISSCEETWTQEDVDKHQNERVGVVAGLVGG